MKKKRRKLTSMAWGLRKDIRLKKSQSNECMKEKYSKIIIKDIISDVFTIANSLCKGKKRVTAKIKKELAFCYRKRERKIREWELRE